MVTTFMRCAILSFWAGVQRPDLGRHRAGQSSRACAGRSRDHAGAGPGATWSPLPGFPASCEVSTGVSSLSSSAGLRRRCASSGQSAAIDEVIAVGVVRQNDLQLRQLGQHVAHGRGRWWIRLGCIFSRCGVRVASAISVGCSSPSIDSTLNKRAGTSFDSSSLR